MARLIGSIPANRAEQHVLEQLRQQLPRDWVIVADVSWAIKNAYGIVEDGQADVVVLAPGAGMVVIEVKGSRKIWIDDDGQWYRSEREGQAVLIPRKPPDQAMGNMHRLAEIVSEKGGWDSFPGRYSWIVAYPNGQASRVPAMFDESTLVTRRHMHELASRLRHSLAQRGIGGRGEAFTPAVAEEVARILTSRPFIVEKTDSKDDVEDDARRIDQLTRQQFAALRGVFGFQKVAVTGPAGSGKTLLALWRLQALQDAGRKAIYVCYNKDLAAALRKRNPSCSDSIVNVDKLFRDLCAPSGGVRIEGDVGRYFKDELPLRILDIAAAMPRDQLYDAIIVDEGQDFSESQLYALHELMRPSDGQWVIFSDRKQDIFKSGSGDEVGAEVVFKLHYNCRNTVEVNQATNQYLRSRDRIESMPGVPRGESPRVLRCADRKAMAAKAWEIAKEWSSERGVVILSPYTLEKSSLAGHASGRGLALSTDLDALGKPGVVYYSTIRSFKGIEASAVILIDADIPRDVEASPFRREDLYVACTRPTARLAVLTHSDEAARWFTEATPTEGLE